MRCRVPIAQPAEAAGRTARPDELRADIAATEAKIVRVDADERTDTRRHHVAEFRVLK